MTKKQELVAKSFGSYIDRLDIMPNVTGFFKCYASNIHGNGSQTVMVIASGEFNLQL